LRGKIKEIDTTKSASKEKVSPSRSKPKRHLRRKSSWIVNSPGKRGAALICEKRERELGAFKLHQNGRGFEGKGGRRLTGSVPIGHSKGKGEAASLSIRGFKRSLGSG